MDSLPPTDEPTLADYTSRFRTRLALADGASITVVDDAAGIRITVEQANYVITATLSNDIERVALIRAISSAQDFYNRHRIASL